MQRLLFIIVLSTIVWTAKGATIVAVASGNWLETSSWCNGQVPGKSDHWIVPQGVTITITRPLNLTLGPNIVVTIGGTLMLSNGAIFLDAQDIISILPGAQILASGLGGTIFRGIDPLAVEAGSRIAGPATISDHVFPLALLFFKVQNNNEGATDIEWASAGEINMKNYYVQKSPDSVVFETIGELDGAAYSLTRRSYSFRDENTLPGVWFYRLQAVDKDSVAADFPAARILNEEKRAAIKP
jgi:hypothetical protein